MRMRNRGIILLDELAIERMISLPAGQRVIGFEPRPVMLSLAVHVEGEGLPEVYPGAESPIVGRFELNIPSGSAALYERLADLAEELEEDSPGDAGEERDPAGAARERCCRHYAGQIRKMLAEQVGAVTRPSLSEGGADRG